MDGGIIRSKRQKAIVLRTTMHLFLAISIGIIGSIYCIRIEISILTMDSSDQIHETSAEIIRQVIHLLGQSSLIHLQYLFRLASRIPASLPFYMEYIQIEQTSSNIDHTRIKTAFEQSIIYFGQISAGKPHSFLLHWIDEGVDFCFLDLWLTYLEYLKEHQSLDFILISRLHSRALHTLNSDELKRFNTECAMKNLT